MGFDIFCGFWNGGAGYDFTKSAGWDKASHRYVTTTGCEFRQLPQEYPILAPFYTPYELSFNPISAQKWSIDYWPLAWAIVGAYLAFCYFGQRAMSAPTTNAIKPKLLLALWNLLLAVFSFVGFLRTAPHLVNTLVKHGLYASVRLTVTLTSAPRLCFVAMRQVAGTAPFTTKPLSPPPPHTL